MHESNFLNLAWLICQGFIKKISDTAYGTCISIYCGGTIPCKRRLIRCCLEDELGDVLWDYLHILTALEKEIGTTGFRYELAATNSAAELLRSTMYPAELHEY